MCCEHSINEVTIMPKPVKALLGTKETDEVIEFVGSLVKAIMSAKEDGNLDFQDIFFFIPVFNKIPAAFDNIDQVPCEIADFDLEEIRLKTLEYAQEFGITEEDAKSLLQDILKVASGLAAIIKRVRK